MRDFWQILWGMACMVVFPAFVLSSAIDAVYASGGSQGQAAFWGLALWLLASVAGIFASWRR